MTRYVGIDCYKLQISRGKSIGIYNYARNLVRQLALMKDRPYEIIVFGNEENRSDMAVEGVTFVEYKAPDSKVKDVYWELFGVKRSIKKYKIDLMIYPRGFKALGKGYNDMVIIHDLIPFYYHDHYPGYFGRLESFYIRSRMKAAAKSARHVLTISEFSRKAINDLVGDRDGVHFIYNAFEGPETRSEDYVRGEAILAMTSSLPHKNFVGILKCFQAYRDLGGTRHLKVLGIKSPEDWQGHIRQDIYEQIEFLPFLTDEELHRTIGEARYFLFLSEIEGFGYPPIEAMDQGTIAISSRGGSLEEVVGAGGILVDNPNEAAAEIYALDCDISTHAAIIERGYENVKRFNTFDYREAFNRLVIEALDRS